MIKLLTGGNGLVGSQFDNSYIKLSSKEVDLTNRIAVLDLIKKKSPEIVIHTAAKVGGLYSNIKSPAEYLEKNIAINSNVLEACRATGVKKMVAFLSTCIFPALVDYPLTEEKIHLGPPHDSNFGYAYAKRMLETSIRAHNLQYGTSYFCVIPTNIYGTSDNFSLNDGHVIPALIHKIFLARERNTLLQIPGDGSALREFIFAKDIAHIVEQLVDKYDQTSPVIVSTGIEVSIRKLVETICSLMKYGGKIEWLTHLSNGQHRKPSDISKLKSILPAVKFTDMEEGLIQTINWFESNYPNIRQ